MRERRDGRCDERVEKREEKEGWPAVVMASSGDGGGKETENERENERKRWMRERDGGAAAVVGVVR